MYRCKKHKHIRFKASLEDKQSRLVQRLCSERRFILSKLQFVNKYLMQKIPTLQNQLMKNQKQNQFRLSQKRNQQRNLLRATSPVAKPAPAPAAKHSTGSKLQRLKPAPAQQQNQHQQPAAKPAPGPTTQMHLFLLLKKQYLI